MLEIPDRSFSKHFSIDFGRMVSGVLIPNLCEEILAPKKSPSLNRLSAVVNFLRIGFVLPLPELWILPIHRFPLLVAYPSRRRNQAAGKEIPSTASRVSLLTMISV